jgi:hypothetical protein
VWGDGHPNTLAIQDQLAALQQARLSDSEASDSDYSEGQGY